MQIPNINTFSFCKIFFKVLSLSSLIGSLLFAVVCDAWLFLLLAVSLQTSQWSVNSCAIDQLIGYSFSGLTEGLFTTKELACSRLWDSGEKSFSKKKCEKRAGNGDRGPFSSPPPPPFPFPKSRASYFRFARFNTPALYYLRAWHRLQKSQQSVFSRLVITSWFAMQSRWMRSRTRRILREKADCKQSRSRRNIKTSFPNGCSGIFLVESIEGWSKKQHKTSKASMTSYVYEIRPKIR